MKLLLDCDDVFERLTRGPFPTSPFASGNADDSAADDSAVETHLHVCHECRELAEALRPAVKLLHEAYAEEPASADPLPVYCGDPTAPTPAPPRSPNPPPLAQYLPGWHFLAAALIGIAIGAFALGGRTNNQNQATRNARSPAASGLAILASLKLSDSCLPSSMALAASERLRCCTDCHTSMAVHKKHVDVARLQLACVACHEPRHE